MKSHGPKTGWPAWRAARDRKIEKPPHNVGAKRMAERAKREAAEKRQ